MHHLAAVCPLDKVGKNKKDIEIMGFVCKALIIFCLWHAYCLYIWSVLALLLLTPYQLYFLTCCYFIVTKRTHIQKHTSIRTNNQAHDEAIIK